MSPNDASHGRLGALVREQREAQSLSMEELAKRSRVSRSSIHRLEHGMNIRPTPSKLAKILAVLGLDADAVRATMPDDEYRNEVLVWLERSGDIAEFNITASGTPREPDLVAIAPAGCIARIVMDGDGCDALVDALRGVGWLVTRPA